MPDFQSGGTSSSPDQFISRFVVGEVALGEILLREFWFFSVSVILQVPPYSLIYPPEALYLATDLLTHLLTHTHTYSTVLLEKLTGSQLFNKFPTFYGTRRFITALTNAHHLSLSSASSIQSIPPHPTS